MLSLMRRHAKSWFIKIALGAVAVVFIFWGVGSYSASRASRMALVNGETITVTEFNQTYRNFLEINRRRFGDLLTDDLLKKLNLRGQAIERLVTQKLVLQAADKAGVRISDETVLAAIQADPAFQDNGRFSPRLYHRLLAQNRLEPAAYEQSRRQEMMFQRMEARLELLSQVSVQEALAFFHWQRDEVKVSYVAFDPAAYEGRIQPSEEDKAAFFKENQEAYRVPERVELEYLTFKPENYLDQVRPDPQEVREIYELTADSFIQPERIKLKEILFPLPEVAGQEEIDKVKAEAEKTLAQIKAGDDFDKLAQAEEAGWLTKKELAPELAEAAFKLQPGQVGGPIRTKQGFQLIKVEDKQETRHKKFEEVKAQIEEKLKKEQAREKALEAAEEAYGLSADVETMTQLGAKIGLSASQPEPFSRQDPPPGPTADPKFLEAAFSLPEGEVGPVVEVGDSFHLILVRRRLPSYLPDLKEVADQVGQDYLQEAAKKLARQESEQLLAKAKNGDWLKITQEAGYQVELPPAFTRRAPIEGLGQNHQLNEAAFRLTSENPLPDRVFEVGNRFVVIHFEDRLKANEEVFEKNKDRFLEAIRSQRTQELTSAWLEELRQRADVEIDRRFL
ncbi:MAG: SurA N-terminal domain-containing protein [Deltaproteobacteria bacterium]|nr:SurA N-terminal domain-containing protein [Deltaproteobacteria bacterium]